MQIVWLASYPKSGNTWLRIFLYSYLFGELARSNDLDARIPDIHALDRTRGLSGYGDRILCKTHLLMNSRHPYHRNTRGFIHILRHPKDVLLSNINYARIGNPNLDERSFAKEFIAGLGVPRWEKAGMGTWLSHAENWFQAGTRFPGLHLHYEQMRADPPKAFARVIQFLGLPMDRSKFTVAVDRSSFSKVRRLETRERRQGVRSRIFYTSGKSTARFVNQGASGQSLAHLGQELDQAFDDRFEEILAGLQAR